MPDESKSAKAEGYNCILNRTITPTFDNRNIQRRRRKIKTEKYAKTASHRTVSRRKVITNPRTRHLVITSSIAIQRRIMLMSKTEWNKKLENSDLF